jgi:hypothetical protein
MGVNKTPQNVRNATPEYIAYNPANNLPPVVSILSTGPIPVRIIDAFKKASTGCRFAKYA